MVYHQVPEPGFRPEDRPAMPRPGRVLLTTPEHFDVRYVINPHMEGHTGTVDRSAARRQWDALRNAYASLGFQPVEVAGAEELPDMVFCANQTLPYYRPEDGARGVVLGRMRAPQRRDEVPPFARFFARMGYRIDELPVPEDVYFEGMGDALWHPGRHLLWGGYGFRTDPDALDALSTLLDVPVFALRLTDPDFYHLDTCFSVLDAAHVLLYPGAFDADGLALIRNAFANVLEAPEHEARRLFACNAHCPDGRHVLIQRGAAETCGRLREAGFTPVELETGEFIKAGGSVFCLKLMFW